MQIILAITRVNEKLDSRTFQFHQWSKFIWGEVMGFIPPSFAVYISGVRLRLMNCMVF